MFNVAERRVKYVKNYVFQAWDDAALNITVNPLEVTSSFSIVSFYHKGSLEPINLSIINLFENI